MALPISPLLLFNVDFASVPMDIRVIPLLDYQDDKKYADVLRLKIEGIGKSGEFVLGLCALLFEYLTVLTLVLLDYIEMTKILVIGVNRLICISTLFFSLALLISVCIGLRWNTKRITSELQYA
ncbi:hypothetical protein ARMSODRAFT_511066 [Armillaria solidipes]|uniref:Uncharacterized protein n=1 Tax=Armillaria solidipes TaxID=1076256 RepID=A0A2H3C7J6_9AGAR|nr:hypothetical protein ARMSODRAFT_511066 [Armillaria solidipes]